MELTTKEFELIKLGAEKGFLSEFDVARVYAQREQGKFKMRRLSELGYLKFTSVAGKFALTEKSLELLKKKQEALTLK